MVGFKQGYWLEEYKFNGFFITGHHGNYKYSRKTMKGCYNRNTKQVFLPLGTLSILLCDNISFQKACDIVGKEKYDTSDRLILLVWNLTEMLVNKLAYRDENGYISFHDDIKKITHWGNTIINDKIIPEFPRLNFQKPISDFENCWIDSVKKYI